MDYDHTPVVYSALARKDWMAGTQNNKWVLDAIKAQATQNPGFQMKYGFPPSHFFLFD
jgi:hypothetical protein